MDNNINIQKLMEAEILENGLSKEDCIFLARLIQLHFDLQDILEKELFFKGGMNAYDYFCKIGIIK